jgi:hypothetical protein
MAAIFARIGAQGMIRSRVALAPIADLIVRQAKINASTGRHPYRTPTPASPGTGPAIISGTLVASIIRTQVQFVGIGWEVKVGLAPNKFPPYSRRTPSSKYGMYLETQRGNRRGLYPFLEPAFWFVMGGPAQYIFDRVYGADGWMSGFK